MDKDFERRIKTLEIDISFLKKTVENLMNQEKELHYHYTNKIDNVIINNPEDIDDYFNGEQYG